ncbi:MAG: glucuronate isomerase [Lachnospiraceae bacterium]|nr:glucuronate isomerase [Lachnospiraceae bacterium]
MKDFMDKDFLLKTQTASFLYHTYAEKMPIIDYHCHIPAKDIAEDVHFSDLTELWLNADHYKWRLMRAAGIDESLITGDSDHYDRFLAFVKTLETAIGNPLYHWSHLELKNYFGIDLPITTDNAKEIWDRSKEALSSPDMSAKNLIRNSNVEILCTTDDPVDDLAYHRIIKEDPDFSVTVLPAFRPDKAVNIDKAGFVEYLEKLAKVTGFSIGCLEDVEKALLSRIEYFHDNGCRISDHGLDHVVYQEMSKEDVDKALKKALAGEALTAEEIRGYQTHVLCFLSGEYKRRGWVSQLHYGCSRNNNTPMFKALGPDSGYDAIMPASTDSDLIRFMDCLETTDRLPKTIVYSLNPNDNALIDTIVSCYQKGPAKCRIQHGIAWWFNDHEPGIRQHMITLAANTHLGSFIGMLTDSRSFVSYTRHEYFRRILCDLIGDLVESGQYPYDEKRLQTIVEGICYYNAKEYFGF